MKKTVFNINFSSSQRPAHTRLLLPLLLPLLLSLLLQACFEPKEGCLDIEAANFDASADKNCCCVYPKLRLKVSQFYDLSDSTFFINDGVYLNDLGQPFRLRSIMFYLSEFQLAQGGTTYTISDTVNLRTFGPNPGDTLTTNFIDDFLLIRRESVDNEVGTFQPTGLFETVKFRLGLSPEARRVVPGKAPAGHPLRPQADSLWYGRDLGYAFARVIVNRDTLATTLPDTLIFTQADLPDVFIEGGPVIHPVGYDFPVLLTADYRQLFQGVDWSTGNINDWKMKIRDNWTSVFTVSQ